MEWNYIAYQVAVALTVAITLPLAGIAWLRRGIPGAVPFALAMIAIAEAALMYLLFSLTTDPELAFLWTRLRFIGLAAVPVLMFIFAMHYTGAKDRVSGRILVALWVIPVITQLVIWFAPNTLFFKHWELVRLSSISLENSQFMGWFWVHLVYGGLVLGALLIRLTYYALRVDRSGFTSAIWISAGVIAGFLGALPIATIGPAPGLKITPLGLGITGISTAVALLRYRLFDIVPVAYDAIFKGLREAIILVDDQSKIVQVNPAARNLLQSILPRPIGADIHDVLKLDGHLLEKDPLITQAHREFTIKGDIDTFSYDVQVSPLYRRKRFVGRIIVLYDITQRKRAEAQNVQLAVGKERVLALHKFIGDATHDLMTPISIVNSSLYLARRSINGPGQAPHFDKIEVQMGRLQAMLRDMLSMVEFDVAAPQPIVYRELNIKELLENLVESFRQQSEAKRQLIRIESRWQSVQLPIGEDDLSRILSHLLDNAIKYTGDNGTIRVTVLCDSKQVGVEVIDSGYGIAEADLPHIFERFYRAQTHRPADSGTGLGLSIAERITEIYGGQLTVKSAPDQGSTFTLLFPAMDSQSSAIT